MNITEEMLTELREKIKPWLTGKRLVHTLAVEDMAVKLGKIYLPDQIEKLRAAALLHDITKLADTEKQLEYCASYGLPVTEADLLSPKTFHARTAAAVAEKEFAAYADPDVISGIRWHTTGRDGMTVFEAIIYLADYIEDTRTFPDCVTLRQYFYDELAKANTPEEKETALNRTMLLAFDMTIRILIDEGAPIGRDTFDARNYYLYKLK